MEVLADVFAGKDLSGVCQNISPQQFDAHTGYHNTVLALLLKDLGSTVVAEGGLGSKGQDGWERIGL